MIGIRIGHQIENVNIAKFEFAALRLDESGCVPVIYPIGEVVFALAGMGGPFAMHDKKHFLLARKNAE